MSEKDRHLEPLFPKRSCADFLPPVVRKLISPLFKWNMPSDNVIEVDFEQRRRKAS